MLMFKSIVVNGVRLVVYPDGTILRYCAKNSQYYKQGWNHIHLQSNDDGYIRVVLNREVMRVHRIIGYAFLGLEIENPKQFIDHIDRNRMNNKSENLRIVSHQENNFNRSSVKGYSFYKHQNLFKSRIKINNKLIHLGYFKTENEARQAYLDAKNIYHIIE